MSVCVPAREAENGSADTRVAFELANSVLKVKISVLEQTQGNRVTFEQVHNVVKVRVGVLEQTRRNGRNRVLGDTFIGLSPCPHVDLEDSPCRKVCPVPHARIQLFC